MTPAPDDADIKFLARELNATASALESLLTGLNEVKLALNTLKTRSETGSEEIRLLSRMLRDGDGSAPSVMTRLALVEAGLHDNKSVLKEWKDAHEKRAETATIARWTVWAAVIGGIISLVGAAIVVLKHAG